MRPNDLSRFSADTRVWLHGSDTDAARFDHRLALAIEAFHTAAFFSIGGCLAYLLYSGVTKRSDRKAAVAGAVVTAEAMIYAADGLGLPADATGGTPWRSSGVR